MLKGLRALASSTKERPSLIKWLIALPLKPYAASCLMKGSKKRAAFYWNFPAFFHHWHVIRDVLTIIGDESMLDIALTALSLMKDPHDRLARMGLDAPNEKSPPGSRELKEIIEVLETLAREIDSNLSFDPSIRQSLRKKAVVTLNLAASFGLTGAYLRANRNLYDMRHSIPGYRVAPPTQLAEGGDAWARFIIRIREVVASIEWLKEHPLMAKRKQARCPLISRNMPDRCTPCQNALRLWGKSIVRRGS